MGAQLSTTIDFGSGGATDAFLDITGQTSILAGSEVAADFLVAASANNSEEDHALVNAKVRAGRITPGTGFRVWVSSTDGHKLFGVWNLQAAWN